MASMSRSISYVLRSIMCAIARPLGIWVLEYSGPSPGQRSQGRDGHINCPSFLAPFTGFLAGDISALPRSGKGLVLLLVLWDRAHVYLGRLSGELRPGRLPRPHPSARFTISFDPSSSFSPKPQLSGVFSPSWHTWGTRCPP